MFDHLDIFSAFGILFQSTQEDFESMLKKFVQFEDEINFIFKYNQIGALNLKSESVKLFLKR